MMMMRLPFSTSTAAQCTQELHILRLVHSNNKQFPFIYSGRIPIQAIMSLFTYIQ